MFAILTPILATHILCSLTAAITDVAVLLNDCSCLRSFRPVCGTDQQTFDNICFLHCAKRIDTELRLAYEGVCCPRAELCTDYEDTVCDQFGNRYDNDCVFEFHKCIRRRRVGGEMLRVVGRGEQMCAGKRRVVALTDISELSSSTPAAATAAASSLSTSSSTARTSSISNVFSCEFPCDSVVAPLCDSQGQTHQNRCKFEMAICRLRSHGIVSALRVVLYAPCPRSEQQNEKDRSSSITQRNRDNWDEDKRSKTMTITTESTETRQQSIDQHFSDQYAQHTQSDQHPQKHHSSDQSDQHSSDGLSSFVSETIPLDQSHQSRRQQKELKHFNCDFCREEGPFGQIVPLCDNANLTHQSFCSFARWNCDRRTRGMEEHILVHLSECHLMSPIFKLKDEKCPTECIRHYKSVCDSNGISHPNLCAYQMHSCLQRKNGRLFGWLLSLNECQNGTKVVMPPPSPTEQRHTADGIDDKTFFGGGHANGQEQWHSASRKSIECPAEPICEGAQDDDQQQDGEPICDSMGRVHKNTCMFAHAHCLAAKHGHVLRIVSNEQCEPPGVGVNSTNDPSATGSECDQKFALCEMNMRHSHGADEPSYCGTDFVTYRTLCELQMAQCLSNNTLEVLFKGPCDLCLSKMCQPTQKHSSAIAADANDEDESQFVCDQKGETLSRCEFDMLRCVMEANLGYNITFAYEGKCCPTEAHCAPSKSSHNNTLNDVCDSNGQRHGSRCLFLVAKCRAAKIERPSKALEERYCPVEELDGRGGGEWGGVTEEEEESENWAKVEQKASNGTENAAVHQWPQFIRSEMNVSADLLSVDHFICNDKYEPVCGSDRRTYRNACHLERRNATGTLTATRRRSPATTTDPSGESDGWAPLRVLYPGECCSAVDCPSEFAPICDNEGRTHLNLCEFGYQRCLAERMRSRNLTVAIYGLCPELHCPRGPCPGLFEPVCATNGKTYLSLCELDKTVCVLKNSGGGGTAIARNGVELAADSAIGGGGSLGLDYIGECCESSVDCSDLTAAASHFQPLCDSRGTTHSDHCAFRKAKCRSKRRRDPFVLRTIRRGQCATAGERRRRRR